MPEKTSHLGIIQGLSSQQIPLLIKKNGKNVFRAEPSRRFVHIVSEVVKEPMFILLAIACTLYFILGENSEGVIMLLAIIFVTTISFYQEVKSSNAINALKEYSAPRVQVIRDGKEFTINTEELVPGDVILLNEGMNIPADAVVLHENDLTVNEAIITGESLPADKRETEENILYQGTTVNSGKCVAQVTATGNHTVLGKLGKAIESYSSPKTLLQLEISKFVNRLALFGLVAFLLIFFVNYLHHQQFVISLLFALTLAMSAVPEEIPVAFSSFMALGAYRMSKLGIISRQPQVVENLGAVSVICLDKTGTITENKMQVKTVYNYNTDTLVSLNHTSALQIENVLQYGLLASEKHPFDAMEKAIAEAYELFIKSPEQLNMVFEYPLDGQPPMMTHVYEHGNLKIAAAKGAAERIVRVCRLNGQDQEKITIHIKSLASRGYRVIGVASAAHTENEFPARQDNFNWKFEGLLALYDPPKRNIRKVLKTFYEANIEVKLLTGDHPETAINIAGQVGINNHLKYVVGEQVMSMTEGELRRVVRDTNIFARMFPDAKLKVINAIKSNGEIVAMTGDGVNDGPALKAANIGIAMGRKGTEIAIQAADLVITDDDLERMVTAIQEGRKIFQNLKKGIRYIISIHIPIILIASLPVIFGWIYPNIFTPIHVIFLELIMGPTCSIFFEREPAEGDILKKSPRERNNGLFRREELVISIIQGIIIAAGTLFLYYYFMNSGASIEQTRNIVFTTLILCNVFLTLANRSFTNSIIYTIRYQNSLVLVILVISAFFLIILHSVPFIQSLFMLSAITSGQFLLCMGVALISVMWFEVYKVGLTK